jgi:MFS family permease
VVHRDFRHLWSADAISQFGSWVSVLAIPLVAISTLRADALQVALLGAVGSLGALLVGLPAGAWTGRVRKRPLLIAADLGRAGLLASIPVAALIGSVTLAHLGQQCDAGTFQRPPRALLPRASRPQDRDLLARVRWELRRREARL